jgi:tripartite-type tricarboxylate transporter receptor subunit TctC
LPQTRLQDIVAAAKASPGSITVATAGAGTGQQLDAAAFMKTAGVKLQEVPYKGSADGLARRNEVGQVVLTYCLLCKFPYIAL